MLLHIARGAAGALRLFRIGGGVLRRAGSDLQVLLQIEAAVAHQCQISRAPAVVRSDSQLATSLHVHNYLATRFTLEGYKAELAACNTLAHLPNPSTRGIHPRHRLAASETRRELF